MTPELILQAVQDGEGLDIATDILMAFTLISVRLQAFLYLSPFFSKRAMLRVVRTGFVMALSIILFPSTFEVIRETPDFQQEFLLLVAKEFLLGMVLGVVMWMPVRGLELTGVLLDTQRGSTQAQDADVILGGQVTPTAIFLLQMFSGYFFASGGFRIIESTLFKSAEVWPFTSILPPFSEQVMFKMVELTGVLFFSAIVVAIPIAALMLLADIIIAFLARSAPTLNALTFGMPVKSFIMCIMLFFYLDIAYPRLIAQLEGALEQVERILE